MRIAMLTPTTKAAKAKDAQSVRAIPAATVG